MENIRITVADYDDVRSIVKLQRTLMLGTKGTEGGFLVSGYNANDYYGFLDRGELLLKATVDRHIVGAMLIFSSGSIDAGDVNNSLLKYTVNTDFHLVKQVFVATEYARKGIAQRFYDMLDDLNIGGLPVVAVLVNEPMNIASRNFHLKMGFREYLEFVPVPDRDGVVRRRSAYILPARGADDWRESVRVYNVVT